MIPEIDVALKKFDRLILVGEVKWKKKISKSELQSAAETLSKFNCKKILIVPNKNTLPKLDFKNVAVIDTKSLIEICKGTFNLDV